MSFVALNASNVDNFQLQATYSEHVILR